MMWRWLLLTVFVVFSPARLRAQPPNSSPPTIQLFNAPASYDKMYEDIEIFRRILDRKMHPLYPRTQARSPLTNTLTDWVMYPNLATNPNMVARSVPWATSQPPLLLLAPNSNESVYLWGNTVTTGSEIVLPSLEGFYLKGQGVIYTARLSSLQPAEKADTPKPVSEWETVRRQLHNEKEEPKKPEATKPPTLTDVLVKVLAENGRNFSQLGANESLTIVLTVQRFNSPSPYRKSEGGGSAKSTAKTPESVGSSERQSDRELLGDLHQKQGRYMEALKAFGEALAREPGPAPKEARRLHLKMSQCYLAIGHDQSARKSLEQALGSVQMDAKDKPAPAAKPAVALPTKLIISVSKKLLDEAKEGKITFEEFRAKAHVETLRFEEGRAHK